jgi:hypothetical protein
MACVYHSGADHAQPGRLLPSYRRHVQNILAALCKPCAGYNCAHRWLSPLACVRPPPVIMAQVETVAATRRSGTHRTVRDRPQFVQKTAMNTRKIAIRAVLVLRSGSTCCTSERATIARSRRRWSLPCTPPCRGRAPQWPSANGTWWPTRTALSSSIPQEPVAVPSHGK